MNISRIMLVAKKYLFARFIKIEEIIDFIFWPLLDIIIWGGVGIALATKGAAAQQVTLSILSVVLMRIFLYSYFNNATNFLYEMMSRNVINLFSTPLTFNEWLGGAMVSGFGSTVALVVFAASAAWLIFGINILQAGPLIVLFMVPLLIFGWALSSLTIVVLMYFGVHAQRLAWVMGWLFVPFSGVYYSLDIMPAWVQTVATVVPTSYVFRALRIFILENRLLVSDLVFGYGLAIFYFIITIIACNRMFERSRKHGLASLERS